MTNVLNWEEQTRTLVAEAKAKEQSARDTLNYWVQLREALERALALRIQGRLLTQNGSREAWYGELKGLSIVDACKIIANYHDGLISTREAAKILVKTGLFDSVAGVRDNIYTTLRRSKDFRKERRGVYRLLSPSDAWLVMSTEQSGPPSEGLVSKVEAILREHPNWTRAQVRDHLLLTGWTFGTSKPTNAISGAFAALARRGRRKVQQVVQAPLPAVS